MGVQHGGLDEAVVYPWSNDGFCVVCDRDVEFRAYGPWLRDAYVCTRCGTTPRQRAVIHYLNTLVPNWRTATLHESSPSGSALASRCSGYSASFYLEGVPEGATVDGRRCENLERLTFATGTFDVFVTQDVLEHVFDPAAALSEIARVLKPGGVHLFTTPKHPTVEFTLQRARLIDGRIDYLYPAEYHESPVNDGRALVTWDFGSDFEIRAREWAGYDISTHVLRDRALGIDGEYLDVFAMVKA